MAVSTPKITLDTSTSLRTHIDKVTAGDKPKLPGAVVHIVDRENNTIFSHAAGGSRPLSSDIITHQHSFTKVVGAVALLQLVDQGIVNLDDAEIIERVLPELAAKQICTGFRDDKIPILEPRIKDITPRMLLNNTNGTPNSHFYPPLHELLQRINPNFNEVSDAHNTVLHAPLFWQPGTHAEYGSGLDWVAVLIERITNRALSEHLAENIFKPLGMNHTGFEETYGGSITTDNPSLFWGRSMKQPDGTYVTIDPPVLARGDFPPAFPEGKYHPYPLGTGLVSSANDWAKLLVSLANKGVSPVTGNRILSEESVRELSSPQLPEEIRNNHRFIDASTPLSYPVDLQKMDPEGSYGFGCGVQGKQKVLSDGRKGWSEGTIYWYGAANTNWWVDFQSGVCGVLLGAYFPWNDPEWLRFVEEVERTLYAGLQ